MDKYKINRNREPLTPDDVAKGQNFDAFLDKYSASTGSGGSAAGKSFFTKPGFFIGVAALGIVAVGTYIALSSDPNPAAVTAFVQPPLPNVIVADTAYTVDAETGGDFLYETGSLIRIPAGAFLDSAGNPVSGKVEIRYREFHDPADIFLAGIPMTYDSAGARYHFESAGMLEITAWQNGKPLKANAAKPVNIAMASNTASEKFNIYYLDTVQKNWAFVAKDKPVVAMFVPDTTQTESDFEAKAPKVLPVPILPKVADKKKPSFAISFEPNEFPELNAYKGVRFEVDEAKTPYDKNDKKVQWEDVAIVRNKDGATYTITFTKGDAARTYVTYVVVDEKNFAAAKKSYDQRYAEYQLSLKRKQDAEAMLSASHDRRLMNADARRIFVNDSVLARSMAMRRASVGDEKENMVMREFVLSSFGIWNSDCPESLPEGVPMFVKLLDSRTKQPMDVSHVFLVEKGRNAVFTYYASDLKEFRFNKNAENMLWAVTADGRLAVCGPDDLENIEGKKEATLTMSVEATALTSPAQARAALGM